MNPFGNSSGFMDLLTTQQSAPTLQPSRYDSDSPSIRLGASEVPFFFSSQCSEGPTEGEFPAARSTPKKRNAWTGPEDTVLISAWLNTSKDPVVSNEQRGDAFWKRIAAYYAASPNVSGLCKREPSHCKQRWAKINDVVCKFSGAHQAASNQMASGMNDDDLIKIAHQIYEQDQKKKFNMEAAWRDLRHDQKWCSLKTSKEIDKSKRRKGESFDVYSSEASQATNVSEPSQPRPPGVKAAKGKGKRAATTSPSVEGSGQSVDRVQTLWEIKQADFALKQQEFALNDKLSNKKLLDTLLARSNPLTDNEEAL
ncbi:glutathione S-transferase T3-like [Capsella rubella]|uniref:glutathione S-transferase T3-like n=1 Tax=Capsella rubella TaxID=81985 RepID=UPI000CD592FE|nr:glutathione S-transferase T3-like [Capsella rubella]